MTFLLIQPLFRLLRGVAIHVVFHIILWKCQQRQGVEVTRGRYLALGYGSLRRSGILLAYSILQSFLVFETVLGHACGFFFERFLK